MEERYKMVQQPGKLKRVKTKCCKLEVWKVKTSFALNVEVNSKETHFALYVGIN